MPLGGSTQQFRSYGKRKTNVINKRQALGGWDTSPAGAAAGGARDESSESSSSSSDSEEEEPVLLRPAVKKVVPVARAKKGSVEVIIEAPSIPRRPSARPSQLPSRRTTDSTDKENSSTSSRDSLVRLPPSKKPSEKVPPKQPAVQRAPLSLKGRQSTRAPVPPAPALEREKAEEPAASPAEESEDVVGPVKRAGKTARRRLVIADDSEETPASPTSPVSNNSPTSWSTSSVAFAQPTVEAGPSTDALSTVPSVDLEPLAPKTRRRSVHPSALSPRRLPSPSTHPTSSAIAPLFPHLLHPTIFSFTSFISSPPSPPFSSAPFPLWRKIGEASYSEVFVTDAGGGEDLVVKIIPVAPADSPARAPLENRDELPYMSDWEAVMREIEVSRALGGEDGLDGFVKFEGAFLVQGSYPQELLASWDEYKASQYPPSDEQIRPHVLPSYQLYALILLSHAGSDLETYKLKTWRDAASVFVQVTQTLAVAEEKKGFEHRDLHWGNILVQPVSPSSADIPRRLACLRLSDPASLSDTESTASPPALPFLSSPTSLRATLIDFTLSRCALPANRIAADPFSDECIFQGEGDLQFDVYRWMREVVEREGREWEGRHARTNVLWLYYLVHKLLRDKKLRPPADLTAKPSSHTFPSSPARPAPSPRKPARRISSFTSSSSLPLSPLAPSRKVRTMPASYLPGGRNHSLFLKEQEEERKAWEWLKGVEEEVEKCLERWGLRSGKEGRKGSAKKAGPKSRKVAVQQALEGGFASAGEVWRWMLERGKEQKR
ncbi:Other/Haspin protein kinase [Rhodotorula toruloides ATCC 204091]|uniref:non-specific serine/threonine protein kinase n=1 Tax=Rhodotorula toruloides TaxID=5286 RepID=A0A0K3CPX1_RHOTO|nr:Other/Haspin protein kinase [Rhodotorula toruloides ATCC 204091]KAK4332508.1 Non-specific serine/threonine protein kinase [Rhodotorula toruloides]PRQ72845.1 Other/Haspin protein kinase [Rhodotorula toruloides]